MPQKVIRSSASGTIIAPATEMYVNLGPRAFLPACDALVGMDAQSDAASIANCDTGVQFRIGLGFLGAPQSWNLEWENLRVE